MKKKTAFQGVFLALALILAYVETLVPLPIPVPGVKLGLPNLAVVLCLYIYGKKEALLINILRIVLSTFLFTNLYALMYSLAGAIFSYIIMIVLYKNKFFSEVGVCITGAVFHNAGQLFVAFFVTESEGILYYAPFLLFSGILSGFLLGLLAHILCNRLQKITNK